MLICDWLVKCNVYGVLCIIYTLVHIHKNTLKIIIYWQPVIEYDTEVLGHKWDNMIELQCLRTGLLIIGYV